MLGQRTQRGPARGFLHPVTEVDLHGAQIPRLGRTLLTSFGTTRASGRRPAGARWPVNPQGGFGAYSVFRPQRSLTREQAIDLLTGSGPAMILRDEIRRECEG